MKLELIVALIGFLGLIIVPFITRIVKISEFRQAWIRDFRQSVSEFNKYLYRHSVLEEQYKNEKNIYSQYHENRSELYRAATLIITHLKFQENNSIKEDSNTNDNNEFDKNNYDKDELKLIQVIKEAIPNKDNKNIETIINNINEKTQKVLKKTWEQVKEGENSLKICYRIVLIIGVAIVWIIIKDIMCIKECYEHFCSLCPCINNFIK